MSKGPGRRSVRSDRGPRLPKRFAKTWPSRLELKADFEQRTGLSLGDPPESPNLGRVWSSFPYAGCDEPLAAALRDSAFKLNRVGASLGTQANREIALAHRELRGLRNVIEDALDGPAAWLFPTARDEAAGDGWLGRAAELEALCAEQEQKPEDDGPPLAYPRSHLIGLLAYRLKEELRRVQIPEGPDHRPSDPGVAARREMIAALSDIRRANDGEPLGNYELALLLIIIGVAPWSDTLVRCADSLRRLRPTTAG